jgi:hypothetical protein
MSTDDRDDPGADTAMFRAYVDQPSDAAAGSAQNRTLIIGLVVAIVVLAIIALALVVS